MTWINFLIYLFWIILDGFAWIIFVASILSIPNELIRWGYSAYVRQAASWFIVTGIYLWWRFV